jgi:hydroxyacylglutathione hydrolase
MKVEQIYTGCLSEATYFIKSNKEAAIVDPLRETDKYLEKIRIEKTTLKYIFITHFHADFVSGHVDLAKKTGATIIFGPNAKADFKFYSAIDNEVFNLGKIKIKALHTPGHTLESTCYLLIDENELENCVFTGDTLFIGDVGRPDLAVKSHLSQKDLAMLLYESIHNKLFPLRDETIIYPAHGAGSACGKNMSKETFDTLGNQKKVNYALNSILSIEEFVNEVTCGLSSPPSYFPLNVKMNQSVNKSYDEIIQSGITPLNKNDFKKLAESSTIIDCRKPIDFANGHIPGSIFIGIDGGFAPWAGSVLEDINCDIILVTEPERVEEVVKRLSRVGIDNTKGFLEGGIETWIKSGYTIDKVKSISVSQFEKEATEKDLIIDVRNKGEFDKGHLVKSLLFPLGDFSNNFINYKKNSEYFIHCQGGYRSMIACSLLKREGVHNLIDIQGGFAAITRDSSLKTVSELVNN